MLYLSADMSQPARVQSAYITEHELKKVVAHLIKAGEHIPPNEINLTPTNNEVGGNGMFSASLEDGGEDVDDAIFEEAREAVIKAGKASTSYLQRRLRIGYSRAARVMDLLEERGVIGPQDGAKPRDVLIKNEMAEGGEELS
jgi:S-DNA-T family DNA segregation ATPase FtsK/SpoIIIE